MTGRERKEEEMEGYVALKWVADNIAPSAYAWAKKDRLETTTIDGEKSVPKTVADKLAADLGRTCSLAEVSRLTVVPQGSIRYYIDELEILKTIKVAGRERALLSSIEPVKKYVAGHLERVSERNRRAAKSQWAKKKRQQKEKLPMSKAERLKLLKEHPQSFRSQPQDRDQKRGWARFDPEDQEGSSDSVANDRDDLVGYSFDRRPGRSVDGD